jgi:hypothetical protein
MASGQAESYRPERSGKAQSARLQEEGNLVIRRAMVAEGDPVSLT